MALIKTISEIRAILPHLSSLSNTAMLPNVDKSGRKHIVPIIGQAFYDSLNTKYNADPVTLTDDEAILVKYLQQPIVAAAYLDDIGLIASTITDSGIRTKTTTEMRAAFRWEVENLKTTLEDYWADGTEMLLSYLFANKNKFDSWTSSTSYAELNSFLIKTGSDFDKQYHLYRPLNNFWLLRAIMRDVEENYVNSLLGRDLVVYIKTQSTLDVVTPSGTIDLIRILKKAVAFLTIKHACEQLPVRIEKYGFTVSFRTGDVENPASAGRGSADQVLIETQKKAAERDGQHYLQSVAIYLPFLYQKGNADFDTAFSNSPLNVPIDTAPTSNGNERRNIFRF